MNNIPKREALVSDQQTTSTMIMQFKTIRDKTKKIKPNSIFIIKIVYFNQINKSIKKLITSIPMKIKNF